MMKTTTLGDCKPGQIVKLLKYSSVEAARPLLVARVNTAVATVCDPLSSYFDVRSGKAPCRLATQAELDQLAERIKRAND